MIYHVTIIIIIIIYFSSKMIIQMQTMCDFKPWYK